MNNKNKIAFLTIILSASLIIGACGQKRSNEPTSKSQDASSLVNPTSVISSSEDKSLTSQDITSSEEQHSQDITSSEEQHSSSESSSSSEAAKYTVTFIVDGKTVKTVEVEEGETVTYDGDDPVKTSTDPSVVYRFAGWDKDISAPINADTTFTAVFNESHYAPEVIVDDFESYEDTPSMMDEGWTALGYNNTTQTWTSETAASVSISKRSEEGQQSLRFDSWENGVGYKFAKIFKEGTYKQSANALQFKLMLPSINTLKVLIHAKVKIAGTVQSPSFTYTIKPESSEFVNYTIPLADDGWALWGEAGKSIKTCADWMGVHQDDLLQYMTRIEFYVQGNDGSNGLPYLAFLDSVKFVTVENPSYVTSENLKIYDRYTAKLNDESTLRLDVASDGKATASIIDLEVPQSVGGTVTRNGRDITFTSSALTYNGTLTNGGALIKYKSATGTMASLVEDINLTGVQVVDNYEGYTEDGKAYYQSNPLEERSGCRGAYYSEYYAGSGSSPWGGNGWMLMGSDGSQLKLKQDQAGAHSGNNYLCLKHSKTLAMRYMQWGLFDGSSVKNSFRGNKLGFWAKSNGLVKAFKVYMYSQTSPTNATRDQYVKSFQFTEQAAISEWKHYEIELNPNVVYYGFMVLIEKNYDLATNEAYLYMDDVEVYAANPYAHYEEPVPEEPFALTPGVSYNAKVNGNIQAFLNVQADNKVTLTAPGVNLSVNGTYTINERDITFALDGGVNYVVTASEDGYTLAFKSVSGTGVVATALNNLSFDMLMYGDTAETYLDAGTMYYQGNTDEKLASGARGTYYCDYYSGSGTSPIGGSGWSLMGGSGDQLTLDKENFIEGKQSLKMKKSTAGGMRYIEWDLYKGTARAIKGANKFVVWLKNQATTDTVLKVYVYTAQQITPSNQTTARIAKDITLPASQDWTAYTVELDPNTTYYGYGIFLNAASATGWINVDNAMFYGVDNDYSINFYAKKDTVLSGNIAAGEASIKFNGNGSASLTCAGLGADNVACKYSMNMNGANQEMTLVVNDTTIVGTYTVSIAGVVTFTVISATGSLASYIPANTVFSNAD